MIRRRVRYGGLLAALVVLCGLVGGCGGVSIGLRASSGSIGPDRPAALHRHGLVYQLTAVAPVGAATSTRDAGGIDVYVRQFVDPDDPTCDELKPRAEVVSQDDHSVSITSSVYVLPVASGGHRECVFNSSDGSSTPPLQARSLIHLDQPLGSRQLIDAQSGKVIAIADGEAPPAPGYLPAGFILKGTQPFTATSDFVGVRAYQRGQQRLIISVGPASTYPSDRPTVGSIHGQPAKQTIDPYGQCVRWIGSKHLAYAVCTVDPTSEPLDTVQLIRIAVSLPT